MDRPIARPVRSVIAGGSTPTAAAQPPAASPQHRRKPRAGWKATIVRAESFAALRRIQKSTTDPVIDLSYLADACVALALELGVERIVQRAIASFGAHRTPP